MTKETVTGLGPEAMSRTQHLMRRGRIWYYNRAFPEDTQQQLGKAPFRLSLRTDSLAEAIRARPEAERQYWAAVDRARAAQVDRRRDAPGEAEARSIAVEWFRREIHGLEDWLALTQADPGELQSALDQASDELADLRRELVEEQGGARAWEIAREAALAAGYRAPGQGLVRLVQRARIAIAEVWAARLVGDYGTRPGEPLFAAAMETHSLPITEPAPETQRTLGDLTAAFTAAKKGDLRPVTWPTYERVFAILKDLLGEGRTLTSITREAAREVFDTVKELPRGYGRGKRWDGLDTRAGIAKGKREGLPTIAPKTINGTYMIPISSIFGWAVTEGWLASNPFRGLQVKDPVPARDKRDPFTAAQLAVIFGNPPWSPRDTARPERYWTPLFALFHGLRRGEIAQLRAAEFRTEEGVPVFEVRGELKNENTRRTLALHPELQRLGISALAAERRKAGREFLLSEGPDAQGKWGDAVGDWFSRLVRAHGLKGRALGLHSFRHNFQDALRRAGLHGTAIGAALAGRKVGDAVAEAYGVGFPVQQLAEAIAKVEFPGLPKLEKS